MLKLKEKWYEEIKHLSEQSQLALENNRLQDHRYFSDKYDQGRKMWLELILLPYLPFLIERFTDHPYNSDLPIFVNGRSVESPTIILPDGEYTIGYIMDNWRVIVEDEKVVGWQRLEAQS